MKKTNNAIDRADDFCRRIRDRKLVITPEAETIMLIVPEGKDALGRPKKVEYSLAFLIAKRMTIYQSVRDTAPPRFSSGTLLGVLAPRVRMALNSRLESLALDLLAMIDQANIHRVIKEENVTKRLEEYQDENEQLKKMKDQLERENLQLKEENENLHKLVKNLGGEFSSTVEKGDEDR